MEPRIYNIRFEHDARIELKDGRILQFVSFRVFTLLSNLVNGAKFEEVKIQYTDTLGDRYYHEYLVENFSKNLPKLPPPTPCKPYYKKLGEE